MVTHSERFAVESYVIVPATGDHGWGTSGTWQACPEMPGNLGEGVVSSCADLRTVIGAAGGVVARVLGGSAYPAFRMLTRYRRTGGLAGSVHYQRCKDSGLWVMWDEVWTACEWGQHGPEIRGSARALGVAA